MRRGKTRLLGALQTGMAIQEQQIGTVDGQTGRVGYVARLKLLPLPDVLAILGPDRFMAGQAPMTVSTGGIVVSRSARLNELRMDSTQATFAEVATTDANGVAYALSIQGRAVATADLVAWLDRNQGRRWVALWIDLTGQPYIAGDEERGLLLQYQRNLTERNTIQFTLTGRAVHPAWYLQSFLTADLFPDAAFDYSFNLSFDA